MAVATLLLISLTGCVTWKKVPLTERDHPTRFAKEIRDTAGTAFEYAQMAYNSYDDPTQYDLGPTLIEAFEGGEEGLDFQYKIFHRKADGQVREVILAFRGTDSLRDFATGNLSLRQNNAGLRLFDEQRAMWPAARITVTGHSLGGGIASHITLNRKGTDGFFFNTSPVFLKGKRNFDNDRNSIVEYGEVNKLLRLFGREPTQLYTSVNCSTGNPIDQHAAKALADCLTWMAAWTYSEANASLLRNAISKPETRSSGPDRPIEPVSS